MLEYDFENDPDIVSIIGTSTALTLSGLPFMGPRACRVDDGKKYILNPKMGEVMNQQIWLCRN